MAFTLTFIKLFLLGLGLAAPLLLFFIIFIILLGQVVGRREAWNRLDSLYWSFITATTVGYGDIRPTKPASKILSIIIALTGLVFTGIVVSLAVHAATTAFTEYSDISKLQPKVEQIKNF